jgi:hypothetical protein
MKNFLKVALSAIAGLTLISAVVHPYGSVKGPRSSALLLVGAEAHVARTLERSCGNCHSDRTEWPWYSYVAPMSWMIEGDVHNARNQMNLSHWDEYTQERKVELLTRIGVEVRNRRMPLRSYLLIHPAARLSDDEIVQIRNWVQSERRRLKSGRQSIPKREED